MKPSLSIQDSILHGGDNLTAWGDGHTGALTKYWRTKRATGGYWLGGGEFQGTVGEMKTLFLDGMARRLVEKLGGQVLWEGFIAEMDLTLNGQTYRRSFDEVANAVRLVYSSIGDNVFTDGSAESGAWAAVGTPSTIERVTDWVAKGTYGMHCITDAGSEGMMIESGLTITASTPYQCRVTVEVDSGTWTLQIRETGTDDLITQRSKTTSGKDVMWAYITEDNTKTAVYVRLIAAATGAEIYADAAILQTSPKRAETPWATDDLSIEEWGRLEAVLLEPGMTDAAATAKALAAVTEFAWPNSRPPNRYKVGPTRRRDGLSIQFAGYVHTLNWRYLLAGGTDTATDHINSLVAESEFVTAGIVNTNALSFQVEQNEPLLIWDAMEEVVNAGGTGGEQWLGGVGAGRKFNYEAAPTTVEYRLRENKMSGLGGGRIEPWLVRPGIVRLEDMPVGPTQITGADLNDPRNVFMREVKYSSPDGIQFKRRV